MIKKNFSAVILAAGAGTRMRSNLPKVLHNLSGKPLIRWVIDSVSKLKPDNIIVVLGHKSDIVEKNLQGLGLDFVYQKEQLGSAHALKQAKSALESYEGNILVLSGDVPLIKTSTLNSLIGVNVKNKNSATVLSTIVENPFGYGRIIKKSGIFESIVEEKDADKEQKLNKEINGGIYCFDNNIWRIIDKVKSNNAKKEYYITDVISILKNEGKNVGLYKTEDSNEVKGINNKKELSQAERIVQNTKIADLFEKGISIIDPNNVYISADAKIGADTVIYPGVFIGSNVQIGSNCKIFGATFIENSKIGDGVYISYSYIDGATIKNGVKIGPFSHIRPDSILKESVRVGNFSEIKKSIIERNSKINHLSYIGDASMGKNVNIGAGTITCNYDGFKKNKTYIGDDVFVGSNVNLIAPVRVGKNALIAAGSTINRNIPAESLAIARVRQEHRNFSKHKNLLKK